MIARVGGLLLLVLATSLGGGVIGYGLGETCRRGSRAGSAHRMVRVRSNRPSP